MAATIRRFADLAKAGRAAYYRGAMYGHLYMDAVITPPRSLSRRGFIVVISVMTAINTATAVMFLALHASPIPVFLGLAVIALAAALIVSRRAARRCERIQVTAAEVRVLLETPRGAHTIWLSPTAFTRVAVVGETPDETDVELRLSDRAVPVARSLGRSERRAFADALELAIRRARTGAMMI